MAVCPKFNVDYALHFFSGEYIPMSKAKFEAARRMIMEKRFGEAKALLRTINHPVAKQWLKKLEKYAPSTLPRVVGCPSCGKQTLERQRRLRTGLLISIPLALAAILILLTFGYAIIGAVVGITFAGLALLSVTYFYASFADDAVCTACGFRYPYFEALSIQIRYSRATPEKQPLQPQSTVAIIEKPIVDLSLPPSAIVEKRFSGTVPTLEHDKAEPERKEPKHIATIEKPLDLASVSESPHHRELLIEPEPTEPPTIGDGSTTNSLQAVMVHQEKAVEPPTDLISSEQKPRTLKQEPEVELNDDFKRSLALMNNTSECIFITGKAGTGKSTLLKYFIANTSRQVVCVAPTGIAAMNIGGQTIHRFFRFPPRMINKVEIKKVFDELYESIDTLIIDEVSMVRCDLIDGIDYFMRQNGKHRNRPFGGVQVIFFGDLFQLPPVAKGPEQKQLKAWGYESEFFFDAKVFKELHLRIEELQKVYRQNDPQFLEILNAVRVNELTEAQLTRINQRFIPNFVPDRKMPYISLTARRETATRINEARLAKIPLPEFRFDAVIDGEFLAIDKDDSLPADKTLILKEGAQVVFLKNDPSRRWVNGTMGKVVSLSKDIVKVEVNSGGHPYQYTVLPEKWEMTKYTFDEEQQKIGSTVVGSFTQYPLKLAWAITIHKSQGQTLDRAIIDLDGGAFAHGQTYVALSRCRTLDGIVLKQRLTRGDIKVDSTVKAFMKRATTQSERSS